MKIRNLDTFYWIANLNSFRAAAEHLNVTQPAITARIQVLEQDLGTAVFLRDTRNAELTAAGRDLLPYATKMMELDQSMINRFSDTTTAEQSVRLGASETVVGTWLPDFLSNYAHMRPNLSFDLTVDATDNLRNALVNRELDLAFLMGPIAEASTENIDLCGYDMIFAAAPHIAGSNTHWDAQSLAAQGILTFSANTRPYRVLTEMLSPHTSGALKVTSSTSLGAVVRLALVGYGICALPKAIISAEIARGELVELNTNLSLPPIHFTSSHVSGTPNSSLVENIGLSAAKFLEARLINNIYQN